MTLHDADITRFSQWWRRATRYGWTLGEGLRIYQGSSESYPLKELSRIAIAAFFFPLLILLGSLLFTPHFLWLLLAYPVYILKNYLRPWRPCRNQRVAFYLAWTSLACRFAELKGVLQYWAVRLRGKRGALIEYKS